MTYKRIFQARPGTRNDMSLLCDREGWELRQARSHTPADEYVVEGPEEDRHGIDRFVKTYAEDVR